MKRDGLKQRAVWIAGSLILLLVPLTALFCLGSGASASDASGLDGMDLAHFLQRAQMLEEARSSEEPVAVEGTGELLEEWEYTHDRRGNSRRPQRRSGRPDRPRSPHDAPGPPFQPPGPPPQQPPFQPPGPPPQQSSAQPPGPPFQPPGPPPQQSPAQQPSGFGPVFIFQIVI